jgi:hypothetical protein
VRHLDGFEKLTAANQNLEVRDCDPEIVDSKTDSSLFSSVSKSVAFCEPKDSRSLNVLSKVPIENLRDLTIGSSTASWQK